MHITDQQVKMICEQVEKLSLLVEECTGQSMPKFRQRIYSLTMTSLMKSPTEPNILIDQVYDSIAKLKQELFNMVVQNPNTSLFEFIICPQFNSMYNTFTKSQNQIKKIEQYSPRRVRHDLKICDKVMKVRSNSSEDIVGQQDLEFFMLQKYMYDLIGMEAAQKSNPKRQKNRAQISFDSSFNMPLSRQQVANFDDTNTFDNKLNFTLQESHHIIQPEILVKYPEQQDSNIQIVQSRISLQSEQNDSVAQFSQIGSNLFSIQYQERERPTSRFDSSDNTDIMTVNKQDLAQSREIIIQGQNRGLNSRMQQVPPFSVNIDNDYEPLVRSQNINNKRNILDLSKLKPQGSKPSLKLDPKNTIIQSSKIRFEDENINTQSRYVAQRNRPEVKSENRTYKAYSEHQNSTIRFQQMPHNTSLQYTQSLRFDDLSKSILQDKEQFLTQHQLMQQNSFLKSQNKAKEREILDMTRQINHLVDENNNSQNLSLEMCHKTLKRKSETPSNLGSIKGNLHDLLRSMQRK